MTLTDQQVRYVAALANLTLDEDEVRRYARDLSGILTHMEELNSADTAGVEPMAQVLFAAEDAATLRPDSIVPSLSNADALANAPLSGAGYFKVPKVIER